jgi:RNA polymerase sigma-70 factor (ECF subfamily)
VIVPEATRHKPGVKEASRSDATLAGPTTATHADADDLLANHLGFVWRVLRRLGLSPPDADDSAQQVFMIAATKIDRFAPEKARAFLYGTAVRVASNARRKDRRRRELLDRSADSRLMADPGPEALTELGRARLLLDELLGRLPDELRRVLVLAEIEQCEVAEIAMLERIPAGTAASRLRRARASFRDLLSESEDRNPFARQP